MIKVKRVYEEPKRNDGMRVLVDRLWPRGIKKDEIKLDEWLKDLAPSAELRKSFAHDPDKWTVFKSEYFKELRNKEMKEMVEQLVTMAEEGKNITLLYSAKDEVH